MGAKMFRTLWLVIAISSSLMAYAEDSKQDEHSQHHPQNVISKKEVSPEMRQKMAEMHQMMADCLKSEKPMSECKQEMMNNCPMMKETGKCPMMGEMDKMMGQTKQAKKSQKSGGDDHSNHH